MLPSQGIVVKIAIVSELVPSQVALTCDTST